MAPTPLSVRNATPYPYLNPGRHLDSVRCVSCTGNTDRMPYAVYAPPLHPPLPPVPRRTPLYPYRCQRPRNPASRFSPAVPSLIPDARRTPPRPETEPAGTAVNPAHVPNSLCRMRQDQARPDSPAPFRPLPQSRGADPSIRTEDYDPYLDPGRHLDSVLLVIFTTNHVPYGMPFTPLPAASPAPSPGAPTHPF